MKINNKNVLELIENDINIIDNYVLETDKGTKLAKEKFYKKACLERNRLVEDKIEQYSRYSNILLNEINVRVSTIFPSDSSLIFSSSTRYIDKLKKLIKLENNYIDVEYKLGLSKLLSELENNDDNNLSFVNEKIKEVINILKSSNIDVNSSLFMYSNYTYTYMDCFLNNIDNENFDSIIREKFEEIYWECPQIITHLKLNFKYIINNHKKELNKYLNELITNLSSSIDIGNNLLETYNNSVNTLKYNIDKDPYLNLEKFLNNSENINDYLSDSVVRKNCYNQFLKDVSYDELSDIEKEDFLLQINNLKNTVLELKEYYYFKRIIDDLKGIYNSKKIDEKSYSEKEKNILSLEKTRSKLLKKYQKVCKGGLFNKVNKKQVEKNITLLNENINKLNDSYNEFDTIDIDYKLIKNIDEVSTIYDLLLVGYSSYNYIKKIYNSMYLIEDDKLELESFIDRLFNYLFNTTNSFIYKISAFNSTDICEEICNKFILLNLNISIDDLSEEKINSLLKNIDMILLIDNISKGKLSIEDMKFIYDAKNI